MSRFFGSSLQNCALFPKSMQRQGLEMEDLHCSVSITSLLGSEQLDCLFKQTNKKESTDINQTFIYKYIHRYVISQ